MLIKDSVDIKCAEKFQEDIANRVESYAGIFVVGRCGKLKHLVMKGVYKGLLEATGYRLLAVARKLEENPAYLSALISGYLGKVDYIDVPNEKYIIPQFDSAKNDNLLINKRKGSYEKIYK